MISARQNFLSVQRPCSYANIEIFNKFMASKCFGSVSAKMISGVRGNFLQRRSNSWLMKEIDYKLGRRKTNMILMDGSINNSVHTSAILLKKSNDDLDLSFNDYQKAYRCKSFFEVLRGYLVFQTFKFDYLVENNMQLLKMGKKVLGQQLFNKLMEATFYGQFVAGADQNKIRPNILKLRSAGIESILDYSAEEDVSESEATKMEVDQAEPTKSPGGKEDAAARKTKTSAKHADRRRKAIARTFFYLGEANCEKNLEIFLDAIHAVSTTTEQKGFAAIKITALGRPQILQVVSEGILRAREYVKNFARDPKPEGYVQTQRLTLSDIQRKFDQLGKLNEPDVQHFLSNLTLDGNKGIIHVLPWQSLLEFQGQLNESFRLPDFKTGKMVKIIEPLKPKDQEMFQSMMRRLNTVFTEAKSSNVRVMVDAEQTYFQPAINRFVMEMMHKYNTEKAIVFNTYQCYLKKAYDEIVTDIDLAKRQKFWFGAKIVRGAYMDQERIRAEDLGYDDPINPDFDATSQMYHNVIDYCLLSLRKLKEEGNLKKTRIMAATHNEDTIRFIISRMQELGLAPEEGMCFGQLYGMCDHISFPMGIAGYKVYKYVPYGPVPEVLPYLSRRALENRGITLKTSKERRLMRKELLRRMTGFAI